MLGTEIVTPVVRVRGRVRVTVAAKGAGGGEVLAGGYHAHVDGGETSVCPTRVFDL